ncbi:MAG TPA: cytochrome c oxidase accessory protein CcoG, partial [Phenylobacterium sp.]|nr:cytochrome c oxidase accessory protein CcoG [Phenylobacterium sp.]
MTVVIDRKKGQPARTAGEPVSAAARVRARAAKGGGLYQARVPIYPKLVHGRWRAIKWALMALTLTIYWATPWIRWARPDGLPQQAVLVDFAGGRFYFFGIQLWPQEVYYITGLLVMAAMALFLVSALFGRLWCGYACPQTVWTDLFIYVERAFEGDRNARMRLDAAPWSFDKLWRKAGKHAVWLGIAFGTGGAWIFYFHDAPTVLRGFWVGQAAVTAYIFCALLTATTYVFAGFMREQVCIYMCPWPRIQGAMLDQHSLQITYRADRGEARGPHKKGETWEGRGDCIDCNACVVVCPMGIDIRDGSQLECINCGLCADACDEIMDKVGRPRGLISYDTDAAVAARASGEPAVYKLVRPRTVYYAGALSLVSVLMLWGLTHRSVIDLHVLRDRNPMFVRMQDGSVRDGYTLKIANRSFYAKTFAVRFSGLAVAPE